MATPPSLNGPTGRYVARRLADLYDAWSLTEGGWPRLEHGRVRSFCDYYRAYPQFLESAIAERPEPSGWPAFDSLIAGLAETLADDAGTPRPAWTVTVEPDTVTWRRHSAVLEDEWRATTPAPILDRGLVIDAASLWHTWPIHEPA
ncbi:MAG: hypothetical protein ACYC0W_06360 [Candidatus Nanopelagicales bacterium]